MPARSIALWLRCEGLRRGDLFSKSDPFVVVSLDGRELGRTEVIKNNHAPTFQKPINLTY